MKIENMNETRLQKRLNYLKRKNLLRQTQHHDGLNILNIIYYQPGLNVLKAIQYKKEKFIMENKHKQLYIAVQDLLIELGITPKKLKLIVTDKSGIVDCTALKVSAKTAQKLIDADLIVKEINWKKPGKALVSKKNNEISEINVLSVENFPLTTFNKIKSDLAPIILWSYLREKHPEFLSDQIKDYLFPSE